MPAPKDVPRHVVPSPCIGVCHIGDDGLCEGCLRTRDEIAAWPRLGDAERLRMMETVLPLRGQAAALPAFAEYLGERERLLRALHPLTQAPTGSAWNLDELHDLLPPGPPAEAAVLAGLVPRADGTRVLLTRRNDQLRHHGGQVSFPGGRVDPSDAGPVAAALRESAEEIALPASQIAPLGFLDPFVTVSGFRVLPVVAVVDPNYVARPNPAEVAEVFEVPLEFLMSPAHLHRVAMEYRGRAREVLEYNWPGQRIWGATAAILYNLRQRLEGLA